MFYRVHQFLRAIFPHVDPSEINWALNHLSPEASELFLQQSLPEQRHSIDVAKTIIKTKVPLAFDDFQNLMTAALLHDCGKSFISLRIWQRVYIVLVHKMPQLLWPYFKRGHSIFAVSLKIDASHALWGGSLAEKAGLNPMVCLLIREHHTPTTDLGRILEQADNIN
ncbi:HD domain-containing protein [Desulfosporosinus sp.]|uniref:HD domain-containing protein n=1 Tax=Desulfosporosinus sp. TaxID=157907 RepID=UPI000E98383F|nr:HD domain-containing protein [Desulfosporosinus sp.]MBC2723079.1 HD domain-containing protein [Desulfosporosinus sp.]MBC2727677.1 HD domain-containing protein [Desulfosporosinus sp.]HBV87994.1 phosphohydrolase [Desulfosporosinus sp.]